MPVIKDLHYSDISKIWKPQSGSWKELIWVTVICTAWTARKTSSSICLLQRKKSYRKTIGMWIDNGDEKLDLGYYKSLPQKIKYYK